MIGLSLPLRLHPALVVGHLDPAVRHLPDAQHLEHQDSKRPDIAPEQTVYTYLKSQIVSKKSSQAGEFPHEESLWSGPLDRKLLIDHAHPAWWEGQPKICHLWKHIVSRL